MADENKKTERQLFVQAIEIMRKYIDVTDSTDLETLEETMKAIDQLAPPLFPSR